MEFSKEQQETLIKAWEDGALVTIRGISSLGGQEFETVGRITTTNRGACGADFDIGEVFLEFGQEKYSDSSKQTKWFAPFYTDLGDGKIYFSRLFIYEIEVDGKVIFENPNKAHIEDVVKKHVEQKNEDLKKEGRDVLPACPVVEKLQQMVGKPVVIDGFNGVFAGFKGVTRMGLPNIEVLNGPGMLSGIVEPDTTLSIVYNNGDIELCAQNDEEEFYSNRAKILMRIKKNNNII